MMRPSLNNAFRSLRTASVGSLLLVGGLLAGCAAAPAPPSVSANLRDAQPLTLSIEGSELIATGDARTFRVNMTNLATTLTVSGTEPFLVSTAADTELGSVQDSSTDTESASWALSSGFNVTASASDHVGGLTLTIENDGAPERSITWPITSTDPGVESIEYANGSGQTIPIRDPFWLSPEAGLISSPRDIEGSLSLPAWGVTGSVGDIGVGMYTTTDIGSTLDFRAEDESIQATVSHQFDERTPTFSVTFTPNEGSLIASALAYRDHLLEDDTFVTLEQKIAANENTADLLGAPHAYVWGSGRTKASVDRLHDAGFESFWIGYDTVDGKADDDFVDAPDGFLVGPYDTWANGQSPDDADTELSLWPHDLYPNGCVIDEDGEPVTGFGGRGCYMSSTAMANAQKEWGVFDDRVGALSENGALTYFLDVDAASELFDDYSSNHPQTKEQDRILRLERMVELAAGEYNDGSPLVVGSESAKPWANPGISYSHGSSTPTFDGLWAAQKDPDIWGKWFPDSAPGFFFSEATLPSSLTTAMFDPKYRVPLYEAVLHDSVVSTDRWEIGIDKLPDVKNHRVMLSMLYNEPLMYSLDEDRIIDNVNEMTKFQEFFVFAQDTAGLAPLTDYRVLDNSTVQRAVYGSGALEITANFGTTPFEGIPSMCVVARKSDNESKSLCFDE